jgi:phenylpropionate dioxygenase-like ring-hydroxylating dioxygenase large terminal subunit
LNPVYCFKIVIMMEKKGVDDSVRADSAERRRRVARAIQRRMVAHIAAGRTTDFSPGPLENDPAVYTDLARAELEKRELFCKLPLVAGFSRDAPGPGDSMLFEELGQSILIVRGEDGMLRGFLNMCTHRGAKLVRASSDGNCERRTRLTCPFHAWNFNLDGTLAAVPGQQGFEGIDMCQRNLVPVPVAEWGGIIFVRAAAGADMLDIPTHLGVFAPELEQLELAGALPVKSSMLTADTNWKFALDTYCEGYHFATLHASTIGTTHYSNVAVFDAFGPHWRINFPGKSVASLVGVHETEWPECDYEGVHFIFPNTIIVVGAVEPGKGFVRVFRLFPGRTPGKMSCHVTAYILPDTQTGEYRAAEVEFAGDDSDSVVTQEDYRVAVEAYANLTNAPAGFKVVYGRNEIALQAFHRSICEAIGVPL